MGYTYISDNKFWSWYYVAAYWNVETEEIVLFDAIDISIAVATEKVCFIIYWFKSVGSIQTSL